MQQFQGTRLPGKEKGATLIVALIMLILISLIGVSSLKSASVVEKMSGNDFQKNLTFQASESAAGIALQETAQNRTNIGNALADGSFETPIATNLDNVTTNVIYTAAGSGLTFGSSLSNFSAQRIMVTSTSQMTGDATTQSTTVHGVVTLAPN